MKKLILLAFAFSAITISCKKTEEQTQEFGDSINETDNSFLESHSISNPTLQEMIGYDGNPLGRGTNIQRLAGDLIDIMLRKAQTLSDLKLVTYPSEGPTKPEHKGLIYSSGQRNITQRLNPLYGNDLHRKYSVYGTDCSGFIINLIKHTGINIANTNVAGFETTFRTALANNTTYSSLKLKNLANIPVNQIKSGDFVLWIRGDDNNHMGIISTLNNQTIILFQSNGTAYPATEIDQEKNLGPKRGVHPINFTTATTGTGYWGTGYIILRLEETSPTVTDIDGNVYNTVIIGPQVWMKENLKTTRYRNGDPIPKVTEPTAWATLTTGAYCYYNNDSTTYAAEFGKLYNWYAVNDPRGLAPVGWHVPSKAEWTTIESYLGGALVAGGAMKETGTTHWLTPNTGATNSSGFTGLPCSSRNPVGTFSIVGSDGDWWSFTEVDAVTAWGRVLSFNSSSIGPVNDGKRAGFSVRCLRN